MWSIADQCPYSHGKNLRSPKRKSSWKTHELASSHGALVYREWEEVNNKVADWFRAVLESKTFFLSNIRVSALEMH